MLAALASTSAVGLLGAVHDDGQWRPWLDGSAQGASPGLATAVLGAAGVGHGLGLYGLGLGHGLLGGHLLAKRDLGLGLFGLGHGWVNPNALNLPLDTAHVAAAKNAQLVSQATEGARNVLGGGVPLVLPADTPEVAAGKVAHAVAHDTEKAAVAVRGALGALAPYGGLWGHGAWLGHGGWLGHGVAHHGWW